MSRAGILLLLAMLTNVASAQREPPDHSGEIYGLASFSDSPDNAAAGFCIGGAWMPGPTAALVVDVARHSNSDLHLSSTTIMLGPRLTGRERHRTSGFAQILMGARTGGLQATDQHAGWNYVVAAGTGVDVRLADKLVWRAFQVDWVLGSLRVSSGFAFRFGH
jgi:hypothetical protein